jgi:hypothetical protein
LIRGLLLKGDNFIYINLGWGLGTGVFVNGKPIKQSLLDYMVKDAEVVIVDEFTGRLMPGRRYSDGLHQALEAKENVKIERENQTLATITFQNYFRMYKKLSGMTGTAETEAAEFYKIYKEQGIPTDYPFSIRVSELDAIDWCLALGIDISDDVGVVIEKTIMKLKETRRELLPKEYYGCCCFRQ